MEKTESITLDWLQKTLAMFSDTQSLLWGNDYIILDHSRFLKKFTKKKTPYRMNDSRVIFVESGEADLTINLTHYHLSPGSLQFLAKGSMIQVDMIQKEFSVSGIIFGEEYMKNLHGSRVAMVFGGLPSEIIIMLKENEQRIFKAFMQLLTLYATENALSNELLTSHIASLLCQIELFYRAHTESSQLPGIRREEIFHQFISLVNANHEKQHTALFYASQLFISSKYLSFVVKQTSGYTPKDWINRALITNAKHLLTQTSLQVAQISWKLNFPSPSSFCKFFRHMTGSTPQEYRNANI